MCSFVSALLSPEASGQQVLHKREDRALNCHLNVTVTQEADTLHRAILDIQDQIRKKSLSTQKMLHKIPSTSAGFALLTAGAHTAVTIMSSAFH